MISTAYQVIKDGLEMIKKVRTAGLTAQRIDRMISEIDASVHDSVMRLRRQARMDIGRKRAQYAASGFKVNEGTPLDVYRSIEAEALRNEEIVLRKAECEKELLQLEREKVAGGRGEIRPLHIARRPMVR